MAGFTEKQREAITASNYRRSDQTREMNRSRIWTPEMRKKASDAQKRRVRRRILDRIVELGISPYVYARSVTDRGYVIVSLYKHPVLGTCTTSEHRMILAERLGRRPLPEEHCHHVDEIKDNNDPDNIMLMMQSDHLSYHAKKRRWSEEHRQQISEALRGRPASQKLIDKLTGVPLTAEHREKISIGVSLACAAKRASGNQKRKPDSPELRAKKKAASQASWDRRRASGPVKFRERTPAEREAISVRMSETWARRRAEKSSQEN